jgi:hypothetical protein
VTDLIIIIEDDIGESKEGRGDSEQVPGSGPCPAHAALDSVLHSF